MFYEQFISLCEKKGVSPSRAALDNGISKTSVTRWKNGANPNMEIIKKLSVYFPASIDELMGFGGVNKDVSADDLRLALLGKDKDGNYVFNSPSRSQSSDNDIKFALFGTTEIDDEVLDEVKRFAKYIKDKKENGDKDGI